MGSGANTANSNQQEFSPLRSAIWPIHGHEMKKFLPMSFLMFFILFVYTMVRDLKDPLVQYYAVGGSTELIPQLKLWFVMPAAFLIVMAYSWLINKLGFQKTFYTMVTFFMIFYILFITVLFPNRGIIHPGAETVAAMQASWPPFFKWIIPCLTNWSITLFYVISELWGTMAISSLFWQFAYQVTMKNEVKRFFGLYAIIGNIGVTLSGVMLKTLSDNLKHQQTLYINICIWTCIAAGFIVMAVYWYINTYTLKDPTLYDPTQIKGKKKKEKVGVMDGIKMLLKSSYLLLICAIVVCYGIAINFAEIIWKSCMREYYTDSNQYSSMMATLSIIIGILTIFVSLVSQNILRKLSWRTSALIPAFILAILGGIFFGVVLYRKYVSPTLLGVDCLILAVWFGLVQDAISKSVKYCLFDATKNMAYVPLDEETKTKGQAAVEVIGGRAGKAGASTVNMFLTNVIAAGSSLQQHLVTITVVFAATAIGWFISVFKLSNKYEAKVAETHSVE